MLSGSQQAPWPMTGVNIDTDQSPILNSLNVRRAEVAPRLDFNFEGRSHRKASSTSLLLSLPVNRTHPEI